MSRQEETLRIKCAYGEPVAVAVGDPGIYDEIEIDLVRPNGELMQLAVAGTSTCDTDEDGNPELHVYVWDGSDEGPNTCIYPNMETAVWY